MGYEVGAYFVEPGTVERFHGSCDRALVDGVISAHPSFTTERDARHAPATPIASALRELCDGQVSSTPFDGWRYLYALEALLEHVAMRAPDRIRLSPEGIRATGELALLLKTPLPIALPSVRDFPGAGLVPAAVAATRMRKHAEPGAPPRWAAWPEPFADECATYVGWMRRATELERDAWVFYY